MSEPNDQVFDRLPVFPNVTPDGSGEASASTGW